MAGIELPTGLGRTHKAQSGRGQGKRCADDSHSDSQRRLGVEAVKERPVAQLLGFSITA